VRNSNGQNAPYTHHGYDASIRRACIRAKVAPWSPGRLRHNAATAIRAEFGDIEAARVVLGHPTPTMTETYAVKDLAAAREVMAQVG
jgi:integrase